MNDFGNPYFSDIENYKKLEERTFKVTINGIKTTIVVKFHEGRPVTYGMITTFSPTSKKITKPQKEKPTKKKERFVKTRG